MSAAPNARDAVTLLPSPTYATRRPSNRPNSSRIVSRSASAWHGCARSERRLTIGTSTAAAMRSSTPWSNTRAATIVWYAARVRATSSAVSRTSMLISSGRIVTGWPPRPTTAISPAVPGPGRRLLEHQGDAAPGEHGRHETGSRLPRDHRVEQRCELGVAELVDLEEITLVMPRPPRARRRGSRRRGRSRRR